MKDVMVLSVYSRLNISSYYTSCTNKVAWHKANSEESTENAGRENDGPSSEA